jgi:UPF0755 protein
MAEGNMKIINIFIVLALLVGAVAGISAWQLGYFGVPGEEVVFTVQKGDNFAVLAKRLKAEGVIRDERAFRWYVNFFRPGKSLKRGEFGLYKNMPAPKVVYALTEGKPMEYKVTVPEGYNLFQVAEILEAKGLATKADFLKAARQPEAVALLPTLRAGEKRPRSIEGYIYPDTYLLQKVFSPLEIAKLFVLRFREVYQGVSADLQASSTVNSLGLSPHEVITLASIVEKETGAAQERPLIASVFVNRLRKKMRLQTDPTVIYGVWVNQGSWDGNIRRRDLNTPTDYNTYQMSGLPAGPIANPGMNAIRAVLQPAESDYLFFVSRNNGTHIFSKDFSAHNRAVRDTQLNPAAKAGKSWRDLPSEQRAK